MLMPAQSDFNLLLTTLDRQPECASEKYEELRLRITKILVWRGCPESEADTLADETLDRIGRKLSEGVTIDNMNGYAAAVCRFVWLEYNRRRREDAVGDDLPELSIDPRELLNDSEGDERLVCFRTCLKETIADESERNVLFRYYDVDDGEKCKDVRRRLAESVGISMNTLRVRACRLRARLEHCVTECMANVMKQSRNVITEQEAMGK